MPEMHHPVRQYDTADHHVIELAVPGMNSHDISVELKSPVLWILAQRTTINPVNGKREALGLPLRRSFVVPRSCVPDTIQATCRNGLLTIKLDKVKRSKAIRIPVKGGMGTLASWLQSVRQKVTALFRQGSIVKMELPRIISPGSRYK